MADEEFQSEGSSENEGEFLAIEPEVPKSLTKDEASDCLNCVGPTFRKIDKAFSYSSCSYAYVAMDVVGRNLTDVNVLPYFAHVMFLDLSNNRLTDNSLTALAEMEQLVTLIVDNNRLESATVPTFPQLQILSLRNNRITTCRINSQPNLEYLELAEPRGSEQLFQELEKWVPPNTFIIINAVPLVVQKPSVLKFSFAGNNIQDLKSGLWGPKLLPKLKELGLRGNGLKSTTGIIFPNLVSLFLADNDLTVLKGLEILTNLKFLHLRNNPIRSLDDFSEANRKLFYLNIRECQIVERSELGKLSVLPKLERIVVVDNPFSHGNYRVQILALLPKLRRIDKTVVEKNERRKGKRLAKKMSEKEEEGETEEKGEDDEDEPED